MPPTTPPPSSRPAIAPRRDVVRRRVAAAEELAPLRRDLRAGLHGVADDLVEDVVLVTCELTTNGLLHAGGGAVLVRVVDDGATLAVTVVDRGQAWQPLAPTAVAPGTEGGRGLTIVAAVATRWGSRPAPDGSCVWAELDR